MDDQLQDVIQTIGREVTPPEASLLELELYALDRLRRQLAASQVAALSSGWDVAL